VSEIQADAIRYIEDSTYAMLITVGEDKRPYARYVGPFVNDGLNLYFITSLDSRKIAHISANPAVMLYFQMPNQTPGAFKSVAVAGTAGRVPEGNEYEDVLKKLGDKSPGFRKWLNSKEAKAWTIYRITAASMQYTDFAQAKKTIAEEIEHE